MRQRMATIIHCATVFNTIRAWKTHVIHLQRKAQTCVLTDGSIVSAQADAYHARRIQQHVANKKGSVARNVTEIG